MRNETSLAEMYVYSRKYWWLAARVVYRDPPGHVKRVFRSSRHAHVAKLLASMGQLITSSLAAGPYLLGY